jgi:hypothetical protein
LNLNDLTEMSHTRYTTTPSSAQPVSVKQALMTQARMGQLLDEEDHNRCSEGNHRALFSENLDQLRSLSESINMILRLSSKNRFGLNLVTTSLFEATALKAEDWMFSASSQTSEPAYWAASRQ